MGDLPDSFSSPLQSMATMQHEQLSLRKRLSDTQVENQILKQQLFQMSALLDIAVSKLGSMGVALDTPVDIRRLRMDALQRSAFFGGPQTSSIDNVDFTAKGNEDGAAQNNGNRRFQLRSHLREHTKAVNCCAFAPGEEPLLATGGLDRRLIVQNFFTGDKQCDFIAHDENISDTMWFEGTHNLLSASYDSTVKLWDYRRADPTPVFQHTAGGFVALRYPNRQGIVFACADSRKRTSIVDTRSPKVVSWEHESRVNSITVDPSSAHLVMGHSNGRISVWDMRRAGLAVNADNQEKTKEEGAGDSKTTSRIGSLPSALPTSPSTGTLLRPDEVQIPSFSPSPPPPVSAGLPCVFRMTNEPSHSSICYVAFFNSRDDTKRLICVSDDNMIRCYRRNLSSPALKHGVNELYFLRNVLPGVATRGFTVRCGFWTGKREKAQESMLFDDGEKDTEQPAARRLTECDLAVASGPDNTACVFDITDEGTSGVIEYLEGHRDRVTGASVHHNTSRPIIATTSADSTVRIWVPSKA
ncbi:hypothetical protein AGDE_11363 [Angomonas deanei]|nr:hypothetical protein AGDE_11363 [Angomonas deanei]|eukprot:EPY26399.1 hypothetical protein AGDE_11363 [Angomonas deanei]